MRLSFFFQTSHQCEIRFALDMLRFSLASSLRLFAGGHRGVVTPVPIPNTEVKGSFAEGSAGLARARVGRRRLFLFTLKLTSPTGMSFSFSGRRLRSGMAGAALRAHPCQGIRSRMPFRLFGWLRESRKISVEKKNDYGILGI